MGCLCGKLSRRPTIEDLPNHLIESIFLRLSSVSDLKSCYKVSKRWRQIVSNPDFLSLLVSHNNHIYVPQPLMLISDPHRNGQISVLTSWIFQSLGSHHGSALSLQKSAMSPLPLMLIVESHPHGELSALTSRIFYWILSFQGWAQISVAASCDDFLLCFECTGNSSTPEKCSYFVFNPITLQFVQLPPLEPPYRPSHVGFVCHQNRFVVIISILSEYWWKFSSEEGKWTCFRIPDCPDPTGPMQNLTAYNGMLYWINLYSGVVKYDPFNDSWDLIPFPPAPVEFYDHVGFCRRRLRLYQPRKQFFNNICIWELKDDTWFLVHDVKRQDLGLNNLVNETILGFHPHDGDIVYMKKQGQVLICNMKYKKCFALHKFPLSTPFETAFVLLLPNQAEKF